MAGSGTATPLGGAAPTILIVDDEPMVLRLMERTLRSAGYLVYTATTGLEAVAVASDLPVPASALVTDIRMEPIDGVSLARLISGRWPGTPILFVSGFGDVDQYGSLRGPLLPKPFSPAQFLQAVQRLMTNEEAPRGS